MEQKNIEEKGIEKKIFVFSVFLLGLIIVMSIMICYFLLSDKILNLQKKEADTAIEVNTEINSQITTKPIYTVKEYNNKIGIFKNDSLVYTMDTYIFTLPESDKRLLAEGIRVDTIEELEILIEEYS